MSLELGSSSSRRWITAVLAVVVASFLAASALVHWRMKPIDDAAGEIAANTAPSIERLADARAELRQLQLLLDEAGPQIARAEPIDVERLLRSLAALNEEVDGYLSLPTLPSERELWSRVSRTRSDVESATTRFLVGAAEADRAQAALAVGHLYDALTSTIRENASHTVAFAERIQEFRSETTYLARVLYASCITVAAVGAVFVQRVMRAHAALVAENRKLDHERASELEAFAGRVAHDILSPLNAVGLALGLLGRDEQDERRLRLVDRGTTAVERIKTLVTGLLDFARAGGKPREDARADLATTIDEVVTSLEPEARAAGAELTAPAVAAHVVACNPGVLTSLLSNLVRNAIKYLGDGLERRVTIRVRERGERVRVEVVDTGMGVPPALEQRIFEPYVRAPHTKQPGVGLGLATVKRLAEAHGGAVGLESEPGRGSTFWFELPRASRVTTP